MAFGRVRSAAEQARLEAFIARNRGDEPVSADQAVAVAGVFARAARRAGSEGGREVAAS